MGQLTAYSPNQPSSANSLQPIQLPTMPQQGQTGGQPSIASMLMQGLTNYYNQGTQGAGNPNAAPPSIGSSMLQGLDGGLNKWTTGMDNSLAGQAINGVAGNTAGNGYASQLMNGMFGAATPAAGTAAAGAGMANGAASGGIFDSLLSML